MFDTFQAMYDEIAKVVENGEIHPKDVVTHIRNLNGNDFKKKKKVGGIIIEILSSS